MPFSMRDRLFIALPLGVSIFFNVISHTRPYARIMQRLSQRLEHKLRKGHSRNAIFANRLQSRAQPRRPRC